MASVSVGGLDVQLDSGRRRELEGIEARHTAARVRVLAAFTGQGHY